MNIVASLIIGYLVGCFQSAYIISKWKGHIDIRKYGSGNAGTTNMIRVMGWKAGVITFIMDLLKAVVGVYVAYLIFGDMLYGFYGGVGVVLGHNYPVFLGFRGGKGIASTLGLLLAVDWRIGLIAAGIMAIVILTSRYVSLGSIMMAVGIPVLMFVFYRDSWQYVMLGGILMVLAFYTHRANIKRLLQGEESKIGHKKNLAENK